MQIVETAPDMLTGGRVVYQALLINERMLMSHAIAAYHGKFGRACVYDLDRSMAMHAHREGHLIFHLHGPAPKIEVSGRQHKTNTFSAIAVNPLQPHDLQIKEHVAVTMMLILYINPAWFREVGGGREDVLRFGCSQFELSAETQKLVHHVAKLLIDQERGYVLEGHLYELTQFCHDHSWQRAPDELMKISLLSNFRDRRVRKAAQLMNERIGHEIQLDDIALASALSRPHFYKLFRENVGVTPNVYLNTLRMEHAIDRLVTTDEAVTAIGLDLGFASQASFSRFFVSNVGIAPTAYRRVAHVA